MKPLTPTLRTLVHHLMEHAKDEEVVNPKPDPSTFSVIEQIRPLLVTLMGSGGYAALLSRAHVLAAVDVGWLRAAQVDADGALNLPTDRPERLNIDEMRKAEVAVLVQLLGLLVAFIGEALTVRLAADVWPDVQVDKWMLRKGGQRDKTP